MPVLNGNGLILFTNSGREGHKGNVDIYQFTRSSLVEPFSTSKRLPEPVNTAAFDVPEWTSFDGLLLMATVMDGKSQTPKLYWRDSLEDEFTGGVDLGGIFSTLKMGRPFITPGGERMYFHSRELKGGPGETDLWMTRRVKK